MSCARCAPARPRLRLGIPRGRLVPNPARSRSRPRGECARSRCVRARRRAVGGADRGRCDGRHLGRSRCPAGRRHRQHEQRDSLRRQLRRAAQRDGRRLARRGRHPRRGAAHIRAAPGESPRWTQRVQFPLRHAGESQGARLHWARSRLRAHRGRDHHLQHELQFRLRQLGRRLILRDGFRDRGGPRDRPRSRLHLRARRCGWDYRGAVSVRGFERARPLPLPHRRTAHDQRGVHHLHTRPYARCERFVQRQRADIPHVHGRGRWRRAAGQPLEGHAHDRGFHRPDGADARLRHGLRAE